MSDLKNRFQKNSYLQLSGILLLLLLSALLLWFNSVNSSQAVGAIAAQVRFEGEYRIEDGQWQNVMEGQHIPATRGDVTLRGNFHLYSPDGEYAGLLGEDTRIAFYTNHINLIFCEGENKPYVIDHENPLFGVSACGVDWSAHSFTSDTTEPVEIIVRNPHCFGNETAIDEMLSSVAIWESIDFEKGILENDKIQRNVNV